MFAQVGAHPLEFLPGVGFHTARARARGDAAGTEKVFLPVPGLVR